MRQHHHTNPHPTRWEAFFQPIGPPPEETPIHSPVRDDAHIGQTEDLDREPDGVPHAVVGMTALFAVMLAVLLVVVFFTGATVGHVAAAILLVLAVPVVIGGLSRKAARDRDPVHPSR